MKISHCNVFIFTGELKHSRLFRQINFSLKLSLHPIAKIYGVIPTTVGRAIPLLIINMLCLKK